MVIVKNHLRLVCICRKCDIITAKYTFQGSRVEPKYKDNSFNFIHPLL